MERNLSEPKKFFLFLLFLFDYTKNILTGARIRATQSLQNYIIRFVCIHPSVKLCVRLAYGERNLKIMFMLK